MRKSLVPEVFFARAGPSARAHPFSGLIAPRAENAILIFQDIAGR
ncbi:MAG: hypothetical protein RBT86_08460 [Azospira sp.]|jgi:hypothetical protein|nr:hypothetical protein [Azospira sp.]